MKFNSKKKQMHDLPPTVTCKPSPGQTHELPGSTLGGRPTGGQVRGATPHPLLPQAYACDSAVRLPSPDWQESLGLAAHATGDRCPQFSTVFLQFLPRKFPTLFAQTLHTYPYFSIIFPQFTHNVCIFFLHYFPQFSHSFCTILHDLSTMKLRIARDGPPFALPFAFPSSPIPPFLSACRIPMLA